jgi:hypothetical protein
LKYQTRFWFCDNLIGEWEDTSCRKSFAREADALRHGAKVAMDTRDDGIWCRFTVFKNGERVFPEEQKARWYL